MSFGPSKPKPDYKNMWGSYSEWLREAKSTFSKSSSTARAKAAASGITGGTPEAVQQAQQSAFQKEMLTLRGGSTADTLKKSASYAMSPSSKRVKKGDEWLTKVIPPQFGLKSKDYEKFAGIFREQTGAEPEPWEVYFTKKFGFADFDISEKDKAVFRAEGAAGKRALGASIKGPHTLTSCPWI